MKKIAILISYLPNPRIYKRIELEKTLGEVHLICWDRKVNMHFPPSGDGYTVHCIQRPARSNPLRRMIPFARFSAEAKKILRSIDPDLIHVQGLDMLQIAESFRSPGGKRVRILYEIPDLHPLQAARQKTLPRKAVGALVRALDRRLCRKADLLLVTSEKFIDTYYGAFVPREKVFFFPNVPDPEVFRHYRKKSADTPLTVGFIGILLYKQQLRYLVQAAEACEMPLLVAGLENEPPEIEPLVRAYPGGEWFGRFNFPRQAAELYGKCDIIFCVYDTDVENVRVLLPNKLYEAVLCETPILVAKDTYVAEIVEKWGVGVAVDPHDPEELTAVLRRLQEDRDEYDRMAANCRLHQPEIRLEYYNRILREKIMAFWPEDRP